MSRLDTCQAESMESVIETVNWPQNTIITCPDRTNPYSSLHIRRTYGDYVNDSRLIMG